MADFRERELTSFKPRQIEQAIRWAHQNGVTYQMRHEGLNFRQAFTYALETAAIDEQGKPMDERGRERLGHARDVFHSLAVASDELSDVHGAISVWSTRVIGSVEVRYQVANRFSSARDAIQYTERRIKP